MPLFFYLPLIVWTGMVEAMADATTHDPDERNGRGDPANPMMDDTARIISFPRAAIGAPLGCLGAVLLQSFAPTQS